MQLADMTQVIAITVLCYGVGIAAKAFDKIPDKVIPVVTGLTGIVLGVAMFYLVDNFPATDVVTAAAVGLWSGWSSTGIDQLQKQLKKRG